MTRHPSPAPPTSSPSSLQDRHADVLRELLDHLAPQDRQAVRLAADRLGAALRPHGGVRDSTVLVGYGGGKDSSYTVAFVRAVQLFAARRDGTLFTLRSATNRHAGMPRAVMENIDRTYRALGMYDDPSCELLLLDGGRIRPFRHDLPADPAVTARNRADILMTGHRTAAQARPTFCNACNLSMANSFGLAAAHGRGADLIVTGDSREEQRDYAVWINRLGRQVGHDPRARRRTGFPRVLGALDTVSRAYARTIHGEATPEDPGVHADVPADLSFFSIFEDTPYDSGSHWELLTEFLGFRFDDLAFSFTESDCANPALMAHLRGLTCEHVYGRSYDDGMDEYVSFALRLMRRKDFPQRLIDRMAERYAGTPARAAVRDAVERFAAEAYDLTPQHLVCLVHAPFTARGQRLSAFLRAEHPELAAAEPALRALLAAPADEPVTGPDLELAASLEEISGLTLPQARRLYADDRPGSGALVNRILEDDPHKELISTRHSADGPTVHELLSGR
ncbi:PqqD family protein [Streptomyces sp. NPDC088915]|uniref:PqqD family protein n=1 Tax=Streptomyces sp. NPDC088915 TaxID=3365912 RepID=UPI00380EDA88